MSMVHFIRPWWLLFLLPWLWLFFTRKRSQTQSLDDWQTICDPHLLPYVLHTADKTSKTTGWFYFWLSLGCLIIALAGPTWSKSKVPTYKTALPRVVILEMSEAMLQNKGELTRAKFLIKDILAHPQIGQLALVLFSSEAFIASPLTEDTKTIEALLPSINKAVMPLGGHRLSQGLKEAQQLLKRAGFSQGELLVIAATAPTIGDNHLATDLAKKGLRTSILPINSEANTRLSAFSKVQSVSEWLALDAPSQSQWLIAKEGISIWQDEGYWLIIPALFLLLPVFRRQRVTQ